jgi:hypothetical protein
MAALAMCFLHAPAVEPEERDILFFYDSWAHMYNAEPDTMIVDAAIDFCSPFELYFETSDKKVNKRISKKYLAVTMGNSTWFINSNYLRDNFKGDAKRLHGYVPLFFDEKVAYAVAEEYMYAELGDIGFNVVSTHNYLIDFLQRKVLRIDEKSLIKLLTDYPDLRMRYEGMQDNDRERIINDYFVQYVDRVSDDSMHPYILDILDSTIERK